MTARTRQPRGGRLQVTLLLLLLIAAPFSSSGCWDRTEVDDLAFIMAIGLDEAPDNQVYATFHIAVPRAVAGAGGVGGGSGGGEAGQQTSLIITLAGRSVLSLMNLLSTHVDRRPTLVHGKMVVIGERLARRGISPYITELVRFRETRRTMFLAVVRGTAKEFIEKNRPVLEQNPAKNLELLALASKQAGLIPPSQLNRFLVEMQSLGEEPVTILAGIRKETTEVPAERANPGESGGPDESRGGSQTGTDGDGNPRFPVARQMRPRGDSDHLAGQSPTVGGNPVELLGGAVFRGDRMVGELAGQDVRTMLMIRGNFKRGILDVEDPLAKGRYVSCSVRLARPTEIAVSREGRGFFITVKIMLEGEVIGTQSLVDYSDPKNLKTLERHVAEEQRKACQELVEKAQTSLRADIFAFGNKARHLVRTWDQWEDLDWPDKFPEARVDVSVRFDLRRTGLLFKPPLPSTKRESRAGGR